MLHLQRIGIDSYKLMLMHQKKHSTSFRSIIMPMHVHTFTHAPQLHVANTQNGENALQKLQPKRLKIQCMSCSAPCHHVRSLPMQSSGNEKLQRAILIPSPAGSPQLKKVLLHRNRCCTELLFLIT